jgi:hypothetical protein
VIFGNSEITIYLYRDYVIDMASLSGRRVQRPTSLSGKVSPVSNPVTCPPGESYQVNACAPDYNLNCPSGMIRAKTGKCVEGVIEEVFVSPGLPPISTCKITYDPVTGNSSTVCEGISENECKKYAESIKNQETQKTIKEAKYKSDIEQINQNIARIKEMSEYKCNPSKLVPVGVNYSGSATGN